MTPRAGERSAGGVSLASASASSNRSTVTKLSPAFSAICSACSNNAGDFGRQIDLAGTRSLDPRQFAELGFDRA